MFLGNSASDFVSLYSGQLANYKARLADLLHKITLSRADSDAADFKYNTLNNQLNQMLQTVLENIKAKYGVNELGFYNIYSQYLIPTDDPSTYYSRDFQKSILAPLSYADSLPDSSPFWTDLNSWIAPMMSISQQARASYYDHQKKNLAFNQDSATQDSLKSEIQGWLAQAAQYSQLGKIPTYEELLADAQGGIHPMQQLSVVSGQSSVGGSGLMWGIVGLGLILATRKS